MGPEQAEAYGKRNAVPPEMVVRVTPTQVVATVDVADRPRRSPMDVDEVLAKATEHISGGRSFGPVIERDDCVVIPAAYVLSAGGGGGGDGPAGDGAAGTGSGAGVGTFSLSWPVGAYVVTGGEARWVPAIDATRVAVAVLVLAKLALKLRAVRQQT